MAGITNYNQLSGFKTVHIYYLTIMKVGNLTQFSQG